MREIPIQSMNRKEKFALMKWPLEIEIDHNNRGGQNQGQGQQVRDGHHQSNKCNRAHL